ncbi:MAG TPA: TIGR03557 family F420-dependent LLM class oxidoreductase [Steroidobacteraceae bacterium]|nr:TIGR03557 family F420-dependent LLM class oxidoreductase [Steroidobacteraceae bacterium]
MSDSLPADENFAIAARRHTLKSALMTAVCAGLPAAKLAAAQDARGGGSTAASARAHHRPDKLTRGMLSFMLAHEQFAVPELVRLGAAAEQAGFDLVATSDHFQPWQANERHVGQAWVTLGALGQRTERIWMGPTVTCPTLRYNPAVVAEAFATLSLLSPGRIFLGLGSGEALNEQAATGDWPRWQERWDRLIEAVTIIRQLWTGQPLRHRGRHYTVDGRLYDPPAQPIPLLLAANGPKAMKLAGQHGDGLVTDPQTWKQHKGEWEQGARAAGKDPGAMPVLVEAFVVVGDQQEAQTAAKLWNFIPKAFKGYQNIPDPAQIEQDAQRELPLAKVIGDWTVSTDPDAHVQAVRKLLDSGATIVNIHSGQPDQHKVIEFYGREVLPRLRKPTAAHH